MTDKPVSLDKTSARQMILDGYSITDIGQLSKEARQWLYSEHRNGRLCRDAVAFDEGFKNRFFAQPMGIRQC